MKYLIIAPVENYCGEGAGGLHFANGRAETTDKLLAYWFLYNGYEVEEQGKEK